MPAVSKSQQHFMGMVHALKNHTLDVSKLPSQLANKLKKTAKSISDKAATEFAKTKTKKLPKTVNEDDVNNVLQLSFGDFLVFESQMVTLIEQLDQQQVDQLQQAYKQ